MKQRLLYGVCIMILISLVGCGDERELRFMESVSAIESSRKKEDEKITTSIENSSNETTKSVQKEKIREGALQTNKESERLEENESLVSGTESSQSKDTSQTVYSAVIEKQIYLPEEKDMSIDISDASELYSLISDLSFRSETCDGLPEYSIFFDDGSQYYINITEGWIRRDKREARLTDDEIVLISNLILSDIPKKEKTQPRYEITSGSTGEQITISDSQQLERMTELLENMTIQKEEAIENDAEKAVGYLYRIRVLDENGNVSETITLSKDLAKIDNQYYIAEQTEDLIAYLDGLYE